MKVFITGATGFIDGNLFHELIKQGHHVGVLVRNRSNLKFIGGLKLDSRFDVPVGFAVAAGYADEFFEGSRLGKCPLIPVKAFKASRKFRHFECAKTVKFPGMLQTPIEESLKKSIDWFSKNG